MSGWRIVALRHDQPLQGRDDFCLGDGDFEGVAPLHAALVFAAQ